MRSSTTIILLFFSSASAISFSDGVRLIPQAKPMSQEECKPYIFNTAFKNPQCYDVLNISTSGVMTIAFYFALTNKYIFQQASFQKEFVGVVPNVQTTVCSNQSNKDITGVLFLSGGVLKDNETIVVIQEPVK